MSTIQCRIRQQDKDIEAKLDAFPAYIETADIVREALRSYFFGAPTPLRDSYLDNSDAQIMLTKIDTKTEAIQEVLETQIHTPKEVIVPTNYANRKLDALLELDE